MLEIQTITLIIPAFIAGVLTFLAPCTLPLVPGYLAFISGLSFKDLNDSNKAAVARNKIFINGVMYVLGFSFIFILLGSLFGLAGSFLAQHRVWLSRVGGIFVIFFGLYLMRAFELPIFKELLVFLSKEHRFNISKKLTPGQPSSSFIFGLTFAFGWTPCIGPILGTILLLASTSGTIIQGTFLLFIFSIGLALPFLLVAFSLSRATKYIHRMSRYLNIISFIGGVFLLFLGTLLLTDSFIIWVTYFYDWFNFFNYEKLLDYL